MFKKQITIPKSVRLRSPGKVAQGKKPGPEQSPIIIPADALDVLVRSSTNASKGKAIPLCQLWDSLVADALENQTEEWAQKFLNKLSPHDLARGSRFLREKRHKKP